MAYNFLRSDLDGTKLAGNAADKANRTIGKLDREVAEILKQAAEADQRVKPSKHGMRHPTPRRPPMSPTRTVVCCTPVVAGCRATTPRRSPPASR
jgi:hypothetical protein